MCAVLPEDVSTDGKASMWFRNDQDLRNVIRNQLRHIVALYVAWEYVGPTFPNADLTRLNVGLRILVYILICA